MLVHQSQPRLLTRSKRSILWEHHGLAIQDEGEPLGSELYDPSYDIMQAEPKLPAHLIGHRKKPALQIDGQRPSSSNR